MVVEGRYCFKGSCTVVVRAARDTSETAEISGSTFRTACAKRPPRLSPVECPVSVDNADGTLGGRMTWADVALGAVDE